jgi:hypothetical protein
MVLGELIEEESGKIQEQYRRRHGTVDYGSGHGRGSSLGILRYEGCHRIQQKKRKTLLIRLTKVFFSLIIQYSPYIE